MKRIQVKRRMRDTGEWPGGRKCLRKRQGARVRPFSAPGNTPGCLFAGRLYTMTCLPPVRFPLRSQEKHRESICERTALSAENIVYPIS
ncbi:Hypothetical predicted protein [Xyrichtys novacula]|uniref:Uncharacterized protein n=1 Tax=Xyrichtys novacula TaxID=13765 RepID=A0AAV1FV30_XYRNO|nr:Hypothetical predicted protein [Xyrichtys novacula]